MHFSSVFIATLAGVVNAVDVQVVSVARNMANNGTGLKFWPEKITAAPGTMVQFQFWAGNHTVTQSNFDNPCVPISNINSSIEGIYSGYQPVDASAEMGMIPTYTITIKDDKPLWLFCSKGKHCQAGMSMVINENTSANSTRSLDTYRSLAEAAPDADVVPAFEGSGDNGSNGGTSGNGGGNSTDGGNGSNNGGGSNGGNDSNNGGDDNNNDDTDNSNDGTNNNNGGSGNGDGNQGLLPTTIQTAPFPTSIQTPAGAGGPDSTGIVEAAAPRLLIPSSMILVLGAVVALF